MAKGKKTGGRDFKPGTTGNPNGSPGLPKDLKDARKLTQIELERILNDMIWLTPAALNAKMKDPSSITSVFEHLIGSILTRATVQGDHQRLEWICSRLLGKIVDKVETTVEAGESLHFKILAAMNDKPN